MGTMGWLGQGHSGFLGGAASFFGVATTTGNDNIFPDVFAAARSGNHMIQGHEFTRASTVLTGSTITMKQISAGEGDFIVGDADILAQSNDGGHWKARIDRSVIYAFKLFRFAFD
jgi:hypothetical protein